MTPRLKVARPVLALAWAAVALCPCAQAQGILRVSVSTSWNMPYAELQGEHLAGGIFSDLYKALAQKMALTLVPVVLPRKRIDGAVANGDIDLRCYFNPQWTPTPEVYEWGKPLFTIQDVLFGHTGKPEPQSVEDIARGTAISTTLGYSYPSLEPLFARGELKRDDSVDEEKVLLKMTVARTPYGVIKSNSLDWYRKTVPQHKLAPWRLVIDSTDVHCAVPKNSAVPAARTLGALEELRRSGRVDAILRAYR